MIFFDTDIEPYYSHGREFGSELTERGWRWIMEVADCYPTEVTDSGEPAYFITGNYFENEEGNLLDANRYQREVLYARAELGEEPYASIIDGLRAGSAYGPIDSFWRGIREIFQEQFVLDIVDNLED